MPPGSYLSACTWFRRKPNKEKKKRKHPEPELCTGGSSSAHLAAAPLGARGHWRIVCPPPLCLYTTNRSVQPESQSVTVGFGPAAWSRCIPSDCGGGGGRKASVGRHDDKRRDRRTSGGEERGKEATRRFLLSLGAVAALFHQPQWQRVLFIWAAHLCRRSPVLPQKGLLDYQRRHFNTRCNITEWAANGGGSLSGVQSPSSSY